MADEPQEPSEGERLFALQIHPLLIDKCLACHGADPSAIEGGLDLTSRQGMKNGGDSFEDEVLVPGDARSSWLYRTVLRSEPGYEMPPKEADQLSQQQQWAIRDWIDAGAPWPTEQRIAQIQEIFGDGEKVVVSEALYSEWQNRRYESSKLWAYRPLKTVEIPTDHHPIDWLLDQELDAANLTAAPDASARTMIRRLSFGLTGLPPTPDETETFESEYVDDPGQAVIAFADRLLDSPHYGEHFGQHWLDVARYADSAGFANDYSRPNAWRYRDYVVRAFNQDKSYDEFVSQQIAGDELDATDPENLIATGFLRMGPWEQTSMSVFKETRGQWLDDVTDSVGQTFLAHSMLCCKCHDHKFDPVPTRDYYAMMAVFSTTQFADRNARFLESENRKGFVESDRWVQEKVKAYEDQKKELQADMQRKRKQETGDAKVGDNGLDPGDEASLARMNKNISRHKIELDRTRPIAFSVYTGATIHKNNIAGRIPLAKNPWKNGEVEVDAIRNGGDVYAIGDPVAPGALSAAISLGQMEPVEFPAGKGARRKALAKWIVDPANPLTARVIVNRVWSWHFGRGIAGNPNNFGGTGGLPTHPELLDYLAGWFIDSGWSIKKLNRLIVSSKAYRRASRHPDSEAVQTRDPEGKLYAVFQPRRLTAEELRDSLLRVSGELNLAVGGIPCRPDINLEVAFQPRQIMGGTASVYEPDAKPEQRNRRTLYAERLRGVRDPFLEVFNQPGPDKSCELRETSTVAPQALTLLNSSEVFERAVAFAARLSNEKHGSRRDIIQRAFMLALSRVPTEDELNACLAHWQQSTNASATSNYTSHQYVDRIERTVMAEKTGQPYTFVEHMPTYREYQPDLQPTDLSPEELGLAHVCRVLLNMNEFTYLD
ncbi:MAG TPA: hypothetical protein DDW52_08475 [Planctomycetaceae bacterium]|nr:hypothetical protein [Planctomycetaceae bacterium]